MAKYSNRMDHLEVLREKIGRLRMQIAQIQELNKQHRLQGKNSAEARAAHGQRQERLEVIQQELVQLAVLGRKVQSVNAWHSGETFSLTRVVHYHCQACTDVSPGLWGTTTVNEHRDCGVPVCVRMRL